LHGATEDVIGGGSRFVAAPKHVVHTTMSRRRLLSAFKKQNIAEECQGE
jgi:hypothetical protein